MLSSIQATTFGQLYSHHRHIEINMSLESKVLKSGTQNDFQNIKQLSEV